MLVAWDVLLSLSVYQCVFTCSFYLPATTIRSFVSNTSWTPTGTSDFDYLEVL